MIGIGGERYSNSRPAEIEWTIQISQRSLIDFSRRLGEDWWRSHQSVYVADVIVHSNASHFTITVFQASSKLHRECQII